MKAAIVSAHGRAPHCVDIAEPRPADGEIVVEVLAAAVHPLVRSRAAGTHYSSGGHLPLVPGVDGVGRTADGTVLYFVLDDDLGSMAERVAINPDRTVVLPDGADPVVVAAGMNPAMSSWVALRRRISFAPGQSVLILGATGSAGGMAVEVASLFGADRIVAAGRNVARLADLPSLGATATVQLGTDTSAQKIAGAAADVDIVLDYVWGEPTAEAMKALVTARPDRSKPLTWVEIGSLAGQTAAVPAAALRASQLSIVGSGLGSVPAPAFLAELDELAAALCAGMPQVNALPVPLHDVEQAWGAAAAGGPRIVLVP
ncbi:zinc-binding alcohol dehydrogenase family protein [Cellulosimicrobium cellulans]|uniref:zinc-binding alcohol dehydrogenase family protein n=1 Tax=Cellulosimicrobium cellulans TaxID=1710 RepID=UPI003823F0F0